MCELLEMRNLVFQQIRILFRHTYAACFRSNSFGWKGPQVFFKQNPFLSRRARHDAIRDVVGWIWLKSAWGVPHRTVCFRHFESFQDLRKKSPCVRLSASILDRHSFWGCIKVMSWSILVTDLLVSIDKVWWKLVKSLPTCFYDHFCLQLKARGFSDCSAWLSELLVTGFLTVTARSSEGWTR